MTGQCAIMHANKRLLESRLTGEEVVVAVALIVDTCDGRVRESGLSCQLFQSLQAHRETGSFFRLKAHAEFH